MDYMQKDAAPFDTDLWNQIDDAVRQTVTNNLKGRLFLPVVVTGPGTRFVQVDLFDKEEVFEQNYVKTTNRSVYEMPQLFGDFWLNWRDLAAATKEGVPYELAKARVGAEQISRAEDNLIFYGNKDLGIPGLVNTKGNTIITIKDWGKDENAFLQVSEGVATLEANARYEKHTLIVSSDLYVALQRIQPGTGEIEMNRIRKLLDRDIIKSTVLEPGTAVLVAAEPQYMDLVIGQDIDTSYVESVDLNHHLRIVETILPRIKAPNAVVVFQTKAK